MEEIEQAPDPETPETQETSKAKLDAGLAVHLKAVARKTICMRAYRLDYVKVYSLVDDKPFILAGGAVCGDKVSDFDLYPVKGNEFIIDVVGAKAESLGCKVLSHTANALTVELPNRQVVQFCRYCKPSLKELVKSFDFTHIQAGITFSGYGDGPHSCDAYCTDGFIEAAVTGRTEYVGSEYPLSSVIRAGKYLARGRLTRVGAANSVVTALADVLRRGFKDYSDFKDQLDAIDLSLEDSRAASTLYDVVQKRGLIDNVLG